MKEFVDTTSVVMHDVYQVLEVQRKLQRMLSNTNQDISYDNNS